MASDIRTRRDARSKASPATCTHQIHAPQAFVLPTGRRPEHHAPPPPPPAPPLLSPAARAAVPPSAAPASRMGACGAAGRSSRQRRCPAARPGHAPTPGAGPGPPTSQAATSRPPALLALPDLQAVHGAHPGLEVGARPQHDAEVRVELGADADVAARVVPHPLARVALAAGDLVCAGGGGGGGGGRGLGPGRGGGWGGGASRAAAAGQLGSWAAGQLGRGLPRCGSGGSRRGRGSARPQRAHAAATHPRPGAPCRASS